VVIKFTRFSGHHFFNSVKSSIPAFIFMFVVQLSAYELVLNKSSYNHKALPYLNTRRLSPDPPLNGLEYLTLGLTLIVNNALQLVLLVSF
jgi:hypothetical protein